MPQPQIIPSNISKMQNRIFAALTFRDVGVIVATVALSALVFAVVPADPWIRGFLAVIVAGFGLSVGFMHLIVDMEPIEKFIFVWFRYRYAPRELIWKKEIISDAGFYAADSTQSFFPFHIDKDGYLIYHGEGGGAVLLKVEGVDYQLLSEGEHDVIISTFGDFLDTVKFPIQILLKTTPLDLRSYAKNAEQCLERNSSSEQLQLATQDYINFLQDYQAATFIYNKSMYIVIPYTPEAEVSGNQSLGVVGAVNMESAKSNNPLNKLFSRKKEEDLDLSALHSKEFSEVFAKKTLSDRKQIVVQFVNGIAGIHCRQATLPEYVELFYYFFNINESNIKAILDRNPTDNFASNTPEYQQIRQRAKEYQQKQSTSAVYDLDEILTPGGKQ